MKIFRYPLKSDWHDLLKRPVLEDREVDSMVLPIIQDVRKRGDAALFDYTRKFDKADLVSLEVAEEEFAEADRLVDGDLKMAIQIAITNIETFHRSQVTRTDLVVTTPGVECWQKAVAIQKVGLYVPGGSAPLFSTVLMLSIPARIAGCPEVVLCSPPGSNGKLHPAILYTARLTGVTRVFKLGGAHAIAAMAYGTASVPLVYKIFGPGNQFVTAAKQLIARSGIAIDMPAGPSELAVIADGTARPAYVASDLLSQAEHGTDSQVLLFTTDEGVAEAVRTEVQLQLSNLPRREIAAQSLSHSKILVLKNMDEVLEMVNDYAPEHLIIASDQADQYAENIVNAGSVFLGHFSPESAGDYASGTNHTLPTNGYARAYNGVNLDSFVKKITFQRITRGGLETIGPAIMKMAETEALVAHKNAVSIRFQ
jgi:histidinol dehydrogenase